MKTFISTALASVILMFFTGGANFIASYLLNIKDYAAYAELHMKILYVSSILTLSIAYSAPRLISINNTHINSVANSLYSITLYTGVIFILLMCLGINFRSTLGFSNIGQFLIFTIGVVYYLFCQNIYSILFSNRKVLESLRFVSIAVFGYLLIITLSSYDGNLSEYIWLLGLTFMLLFLVTYSITMSKFRLLPPKLTALFFFEKKIVSIIFPSILSGLLNGLSLFIVYQEFLQHSDDIDVALLGFAFAQKTFIQFASHIINRLYFLNLSEQNKIGDFILSKKLFEAIIAKNLLLIILALLVLIIAEKTIMESYYLKYEAFSKTSYFILALWVFVETVYFSLSQEIQVNGKMWGSFFFISMPAFIFAIAVKYSSISFDISSILYVYLAFSIISLIGSNLLIYGGIWNRGRKFNV